MSKLPNQTLTTEPCIKTKLVERQCGVGEATGWMNRAPPTIRWGRGQHQVSLRSVRSLSSSMNTGRRENTWSSRASVSVGFNDSTFPYWSPCLSTTTCRNKGILLTKYRRPTLSVIHVIHRVPVDFPSKVNGYQTKNQPAEKDLEYGYSHVVGEPVVHELREKRQTAVSDARQELEVPRFIHPCSLDTCTTERVNSAVMKDAELVSRLVSTIKTPYS